MLFTILVVLSIWALFNVLFVVLMIPPRKPKATGIMAGGDPARVPNGPDPFELSGPGEEHSGVRLIFASLVMVAVFSLVPLIMYARDSATDARKARQHAAQDRLPR